MLEQHLILKGLVLIDFFKKNVLELKVLGIVNSTVLKLVKTEQKVNFSL